MKAFPGSPGSSVTGSSDTKLEASPPAELRHPVSVRKGQPRSALGLPCRDRQRQDQVVVRPLAPIEDIFGPVLAHFEAEVDEFSGQERRVWERPRDLESARLEEGLSYI